MSGFQKNVTGQKWLVFAFDRTDNTPKTLFYLVQTREQPVVMTPIPGESLPRG